MKRFSIHIFAIACILLSETVFGDGVWKHYYCRNDIKDIAVYGDYIWCATDNGAIRRDKRDDSIFEITNISVDRVNYRINTNVVAIDHSGWVWFGVKDFMYNTYNQLILFNGTTWKNYNTKNSELPEVTIHNLYCDRAGTLWIGTPGKGILKFDGLTWESFKPDRALLCVEGIAVDGNGIMWFATSDGVLSFNGTQWRKYTTEDGLVSNNVKCVAAGLDSTIWFGTYSGLSRFDGTNWTSYTRKEGLINISINDMAFDRDGVLWIATNGGVSRFDGITWSSFTDDKELMYNRVTGIAVDKDNTVWFCYKYGDKGVTAFDGAEWKWHTIWNSGIPSNRIKTVASGNDGIVWFGWEEGLTRFDGTVWNNYTVDDGLEENNVTDLYVDNNNVLWIGYNRSSDAGITSFDGTTWKTYTRDDGILDNTLNAILHEDGPIMWFATTKGLSRFDGVSWEHYPKNDRLISPNINDTAESADGVMWFATDAGLTRFDGNSWWTYTTDNGLPSDEILSVETSGNGIIWCLIKNGDLVSFIDSSLTIYSKHYKSSPANFKNFAVQKNGELWCVTYQNEIYSYNGTVWISNTPDENIFEYVTFRKTVIDEDGVKWFSTDSGLARYKDNSWELFMSEGPYGNYVEDMAVDNNNCIWFGTQQGISRFNGETWRTWTVKTIDPDFNEYDNMRINKIAVDINNTKWFISSPPYNLLSYDDYQWNIYSSANDKNLPVFYDVAVDKNNVKWFTSMDPRIYSFDGIQWRSYGKEDGFEIKDVNKIVVDHENVKWFISRSDGVSSFDGTTWVSYKEENGFFSNNITTLAIDENNVIWFGSKDKGAASFDGTVMTTYTEDDGLISNEILSMAVDRNNVLWLGTGRGIMSFDGNGWKIHDLPVDYEYPNIRTIFVDNNNVKWIIAWNDLLGYDGTDWKLYSRDREDHYSVLEKIVADYNNVKWFLRYDGISSFDDRPLAGTDVVLFPIILSGNYPNPFNNSTNIEFNLYSWSSIDLIIYNIMGQKVRDISTLKMPVGINTITWDGTDDSGSKVSSGVYLYRLKKGKEGVNGRMMFVK